LVISAAVVFIAMFDFSSYSHLLCLTAAVQMRRGLSKVMINRSVISRARKLVLSDVCASAESEDHPVHVAETPVFTFVLPDINIYPDGFKAFLYKELIESPTLVSLEQGGENFTICTLHNNLPTRT